MLVYWVGRDFSDFTEARSQNKDETEKFQKFKESGLKEEEEIWKGISLYEMFYSSMYIN